MARTAEQLDAAYIKVQRWCSYEFRRLGKDSHLEVSLTMREAIRRLRNRPDILRSFFLAPLLRFMRNANICSGSVAAVWHLPTLQQSAKPLS